MPQAALAPVFRASTNPSFFLLITLKRLSCFIYFAIISPELSVLPSFTIITSIFLYVQLQS